MSQVKKKKKLHIESELRILVYVWCMAMGMMMLLGSTYAWYSLNYRVAETVTPSVMKPYHLELQDSEGVVSEQISIGSLQQGETKQIVFSVTNKEEPQKNQNKTAFEYALELIYTNNLALQFEVYQLEAITEAVAEDAMGKGLEVIVSQETDANGDLQTFYWKKSGVDLTADEAVAATPLSGNVVSEERWVQAGLTTVVDGAGTGSVNEAEDATAHIVNRGTYISYEKDASNSNLKLDTKNADGTESYATEYFLLEMKWSITSGFEKYDKETDMIYVVAKAVQPKPVTQTESAIQVQE